MPIYGTSFLDGEDQTYAGVKEVERVFIDRKSPQVVMERQYCNK